MAPFPEDVDVFTIPHNRMKTLVDNYYHLLSATNFSDDVDLKVLLRNLLQTFYELKAHEQIENEYIMAKLKSKLKDLSITNHAVCNCHADNRLSDILELVNRGYQSMQSLHNDRRNFEIKLRSSLEEFTEHFLPHMKQEEEVFQPLLMKYFTVDELRAIKERVINEHTIKREQAQRTKYEQHEKEFTSEEKDTFKSTQVTDLPPEVTLKIMSYLDPRNLCRCAQVCSAWSKVSMDPQLWKVITPVHWSQGFWSNDCLSDHEDCLNGCAEGDGYLCTDEDADIDESTDSDSSESYTETAKQIRAESKMLTAVTRWLLPHIGHGVEQLLLPCSKAITNSMLFKMMIQCPNIKELDVRQTRISDTVFKLLGSSSIRLRKLVLSGCVNITDTTLYIMSLLSSQKSSSDQPEKTSKQDNADNLFRLSGEKSCHSRCVTKDALCTQGLLSSIEECNAIVSIGDYNESTLEYLDLSGCYLITDNGLGHLSSISLPRLLYLDLSGCFNVTSCGLHYLVHSCPCLNHEDFYYCDNIVNGPHARTASGCQNFDCNLRVCCRNTMYQ